MAEIDPVQGQRDALERLVLFDMVPGVRCSVCPGNWTFARVADARRFSIDHKERHRCLTGHVHPLTRDWLLTHESYCPCPPEWFQ